ncbi:AMP-binding protein [Flexivirga sp. ID2601S]|uniref:AMP-binding protein n=1 Tax=Flexivirga aerilata TaxID=1656889 RepID=A0A849AJ05_9MICO|nr:AMP-binding protein [Flexivirga aerilata]NNG40359.1 AMP-binding protein [Flexivirga aerilata]
MTHAQLHILPPPPGRQADLTGVVRDDSGAAHYAHLPASMTTLLAERARTQPDDEAVVELDADRLTFAQLWDRASRVAGGLRDAGLRPGDRAAITLPAGADWTVALWGCFLAGVIAVPVNTRFAAPEIEHVLQDSGAAFVFAPDHPLPQGDPWHTDSNLTDVAAIFYTSGTTGRPKGAMTTHEAFLSNCESTANRGSAQHPPVIGTAYRTLITVPLFHVTGCNSQLLAATYVGGTAVIMPTLDLARMAKALGDERISNLTTVPAIYAMLLGHESFADADVSTVQRCGYGGAPMPPALLRRIREAFPKAALGNGYGMTETAALATSLPDEDADAHPDSVGYPTAVVDYALYHPDPVTGIGELLMRGPNITVGYWNDPAKTEAAFVDGWLRSGDMARIDEDGRVYIVDRAKDMINRGGENVYCVEVENALAGAPGVAESAVVGVPNERLGEAVGAVLVPRPGTTIDPEAVTAYLATRIADFKVPQYIAIRHEPLPRNPGGKILKGGLRTGIDWGERLR